jgi:hypothetical protein
MEYYQIIEAIKEQTTLLCVGVLLPCHFQWTLLDRFRADLPDRIVIPLLTNIPLEINEVCLSHYAYFPSCQIVLLYDQKTEYDGISIEYCLYGTEAINKVFKKEN